MTTLALSRARVNARVGTMLAGKYRIDGVLGVGGMAVVYAATHRNQAEFAIKVLHPELSFREDVRMRFLPGRSYTANSVKHPGAVRVVDDDVAEDGAAFLVMELLQGMVVEALWESHGNRLATPVALAIADQLLDVLAAAHAKGIVHRDIKPGNLFLTSDGALKVLDFGIARAREVLNGGMGGSKNTGTGMLLGTPAFMAPEQAMAKANEIDAQTDLWAVAATFYTLVSGQLVHEGDNASQLLVFAATAPARPLASVAPDIPAPIAAVVDRGLEFDKASRWSDASTMRQAFNDASRAAFRDAPSRTLLEHLALMMPAPAAPEPQLPLPGMPTPRPLGTTAPGPRRPSRPISISLRNSATIPGSMVPLADDEDWPIRSRWPRFIMGTLAIAIVAATGFVSRGLLFSRGSRAQGPPATTTQEHSTVAGTGDSTARPSEPSASPPLSTASVEAPPPASASSSASPAATCGERHEH